jgi:hypothetical protein
MTHPLRYDQAAMRRLLTSLTAWAVLLALLAPVALATNDGRGFYGETTDRAVTNAGFILIAFFPVLVFVLTMLQWYLEKRKDARKAAHKARLTSADWRGGW